MYVGKKEKREADADSTNVEPADIDGQFSEVQGSEVKARKRLRLE